MLEIVSRGFATAKAALTGRTALTAENVDEAMRAIRASLLEGDVELGVAKRFLARVRERALGEVVSLRAGAKGKQVTPGDHFVRICQRELVALMGPVEEAPLTFRRPVTTIMMVGLQGTGKTTTCGKLAKYLLADRRRPLLVGADVYRPAAVAQLKVLGDKLGVPVFAQEGVAPPDLCVAALAEARRLRRDVVIFDTAGRLAIDETLMAELAAIHARTRPDNVLLVCDAMAGQDTVRTAAAFHARIPLSGFVMTKLDGDARGGAALSIREITGRPIKFLGVGEDLARLERFRPEGLASRILGMGDIVGLMEDFEQVVDEKQATADAKKMLRGQFTLDDFLTQLRTLKKMGPVNTLLAKMPLPGMAPGQAPPVDEGAFAKMESIIQSMTPAERARPDAIDARRVARISRGAGRKAEEVQELLGRFKMMQQMMAGLAGQPGLLGSLGGRGRGGMPSLPKIPGLGRGAKLPGLGGGLPGLPGPGGAMPGLPGLGGAMPGLPGLGSPVSAAASAHGPGSVAAEGAAAEAPMGGLPPGITPAQIAALRQRGLIPSAARQVSAKERQKARSKAKAARKARRQKR